MSVMLARPGGERAYDGRVRIPDRCKKRRARIDDEVSRRVPNMRNECDDQDELPS